MSTQAHILRILFACFATSATVTAQHIRFTPVPPKRGIDFALAPDKPGISVGDFDDDGWLDICICGGQNPRPQFFRNCGATQNTSRGLQTYPRRPWFERVTPTVMTGPTRPATMAVFADTDGDYDQDLVVARRYNDNDWQDTGIIRYENVGGRFQLTGPITGVGREATAVGGLTLADLDGDTDLDIVFLHSWEGGFFGGRGYCFMNDGVPDLRDATASFNTILMIPQRYYTPVLADFNEDGLVDLHGAVGGNLDLHCRNRGDGTFDNVPAEAGTTHIGQDMGIAVGDIDNDGDLDIFSTDINHATLYVNDGTGTFVDEALQRGVDYGDINSRDLIIGWGTSLADFDLDGDLDLVVVAIGAGPGALFENDGTGYFTEVSQGSGLDLFAHAVLAFDYDRDGDLDLLIADDDRLRLYQNETPEAGRHWLNIRLKSSSGNTRGIGARVDVEVNGRTLTRVVLASSGYLSGPPAEAHFGLDAARLATVTIRWPSGTVQTLHDVQADQFMTIEEPR